MRIILTIVFLWMLNPNLLFSYQNYWESNGIVSVEAEHFAAQARDSVRRWYVINEDDTGPNIQDRDRNHAGTASNKSYLEILPDTRATHSDKLIHGVNFSNTPGIMGILSYNVYFNTPGEYIVWVRAFNIVVRMSMLPVSPQPLIPLPNPEILLPTGNLWPGTRKVRNGLPIPSWVFISIGALIPSPLSAANGILAICTLEGARNSSIIKHTSETSRRPAITI